MIIKFKVECAECGRSVKVALWETGKDFGTGELIVEPCKHCLKVEYNRGHVEGEIHRDKVISKTREANDEP